ncbi:XRE family transcriptional regulator [Streptomyces indiaensis]|uniref:HTH cro/C1-type domain-containing protein n=1 Tax=Streptomyces indiaensis TaxID=284033 RepID=A0ABN3D501_9ACTN|nr:XRE family transcriptional regulator [Streptomyces indiaensis]MCF1647309.1 helix-turn-helix domain-containing protein [Streptomyces indiaensis]
MAVGFGQVDAAAPQVVREFADRLRSVAQAAGYVGVRELAAGTGVGRTTVSDALTAKRVPTWTTLAALLRGCDITPDRDWAKACEAAREAMEREKRAAKGASRPGDEPDDQAPTTPSPIGPGTFSIRAPYGELPPRLRGRDELLNQLEVKLAAGESRVQVLYGLGGCGKTTVALHLARHARDRGYSVFWLSASTPDRMVTGMKEVVRELGAEEEAIEAAWSGRISATDLVWRELDASERPWLLVVDNADEPGWLASDGGSPGDGTGWLRSSPAGMTVVTSRLSNPDVWGRESDTHRVGVLSPEDGRDVLLDLAGQSGDPAEALVLSERLDGLPLALKLAGSYLARSARGAGLLRRNGQSLSRVRTFAAYTEALGKAGASFLDQGEEWRLDESDMERTYRRLVSRTWEISLDLLDEQQLPEARSLMRLLSCCAPAPLPVELLDPALWNTPSDSDPALDRADRALEALIDLSLIDVVDIAPGGTLKDQEPMPCLVSHRLVLEANALRLAGGSPQEHIAVWNAIARIIEKGAEPTPEHPRNWPWWRLMAPHVVATLTAAPDNDEVLLPLLRSGLAAYAFHAFSSRFDSAAEIARLLEERGAFLANNHPLRLSIRHRAALSLLNEQEQLSEFEEILSDQLTALGPEHPETLITRHDIAIHMEEDSAEQEAELRAVLDARRRTLGPADCYTLLTHGALASVVEARGHGNDEFKAEYRALIEHTRSTTPEDHRFLPLHSRHQMAHALDSTERWTEAESEYRSVLDDLEEYGELGSNLYRDLTRCLANNLQKQKKYTDAVEVIDKLLPWFDSRDLEHSPVSPWALHIRHLRGDLLAKCGRNVEAETEIRAVLEERLKTSDPNDSVVLSERHCLAHALEGINRCTEAQDELRDVASTYAKILGSNDKHTRGSRFCLARSLHLHGHREDALGLYEQVLAAEVAELGSNHSDTLVTRFRRDQCRYDMGILKSADALAALESTKTKLAEITGDDHPRVSTIRSVISAIENGEFDKQESAAIDQE